MSKSLKLVVTNDAEAGNPEKLFISYEKDGMFYDVAEIIVENCPDPLALAHKMAAATDTLKALERVYDEYMQEDPPASNFIRRTLEAAIAKARGES